MHTFQPMTADMMEFDPFTKIGKEWALLTAGSKEKASLFAYKHVYLLNKQS